MSTTEDQLKELQAALSQAQARKVRAQVAVDNATAVKEQATKALSEHGIKTKADAQRRIDELKADLQKKIQEIEQQLEESGA